MSNLSNIINRLKGNLAYKKHKVDLHSLSYFLLFVGWPRSGHTLIGALLDAHPSVLVANELNALQKYVDGHSLESIYGQLILNAQQHASKNKINGQYKYKVDNAHHGVVENIRVIGDKKGGRTSLLLLDDNLLLSTFSAACLQSLKILVVTRNPLENIGSMIRHGHHPSIQKATHIDYIDWFFAIDKMIVKTVLPSFECLHVRHEDLVKDSDKTISKLLSFFNLSPSAALLESSKKLIFSAPAAHALPFTEHEKDQIISRSKLSPLFSNYFQ